jgi:hypothetical protein
VSGGLSGNPAAVPKIRRGTDINPKLKLAGRAAVVGAISVSERFRTTMVTDRHQVPISGAHVTVEWLTSVLCRDTAGATVVGVDFPGGSSGTSERVALRVTYNEVGAAAGLPRYVFTKATKSFRQRLTLGGAGVLYGETQFYTGLRDKSTLEAPRGYWGRVDPVSWRSIAVMEDIAATKGAKFWDPTNAFTREQITDLVGELARLHAPLWGHPGTTGLNTPADYISNTSKFLNIRKRCEVGMRRSREVMPASLLGQHDRLFDATVRSMDIAAHHMPRTLLHGDCHAGQTYITDTGKMGIGDWQVIQQGGWAFDFAYLVNSGCEPDDRRQWQDSLVTEYITTLRKLGGPNISFDDAMRAYRQQSFWPYAAWAFTIGRAFYQPNMQPVEFCLAIVRRTAAAIQDLDSFAAVGA